MRGWQDRIVKGATSPSHWFADSAAGALLAATSDWDDPAHQLRRRCAAAGSRC
jgi:hypothetical protein